MIPAKFQITVVGQQSHFMLLLASGQRAQICCDTCTEKCYKGCSDAASV